VFPVRYELIFYVIQKKVDRLCGLVVRVPGYRTEMYCVSCEVRTKFIYVACYVAYVQRIHCIKIVLQITNCISHLRMARRVRNM
jgi:hypothetical protein